MNKIMAGIRTIDANDYPRIAAFFGLQPYQLLQPGIAGRHERRRAERRASRDRRHQTNPQRPSEVEDRPSLERISYADGK